MFYSKNPQKLPHAKAFARVMERLEDHGSAHPRRATGKKTLSVEVVERVKNFFTENYRSHIREASGRLDLSMRAVWKVLRKKLKLKAFKPHKVKVSLTISTMSVVRIGLPRNYGFSKSAIFHFPRNRENVIHFP